MIYNNDLVLYKSNLFTSNSGVKNRVVNNENFNKIKIYGFCVYNLKKSAKIVFLNRLIMPVIMITCHTNKK
jgi:hypothetical protein